MCMYFSSIALRGALPPTGVAWRCLEILLMPQAEDGAGWLLMFLQCVGQPHGRVTVPRVSAYSLGSSQALESLIISSFLPPIPPLSLSLSSFPVKLDIYI